VVAINGWNRLSIAFRAEAGTYRPGMEQTPAAKAAELLVLDVFNDVAEPEQVRRAFITAAKASDIKFSS